MYKKVLKNIHSEIRKNESFLEKLLKNSDRKPHGIHDKIPHYIFSAENPLHPAKFSMSHDETLEFLKDKGYHAEEMSGKYGNEEKSIIIHNPPKHSFRHLNRLAQDLGQESSIISDGNEHEMHYLNGRYAGQHHKGQGTILHDEAPEDYYSTLNDGTHFSHGFDFEKRHKDSDFLKEVPGKIKKSEQLIINGKYRLAKAESGPKHKLALASPGTKLIHYSPKENLEELHPDHHGVRRIGSEAKQGAPTHRMTFYYAEGVQPESLVTSGSKSKYVVELGNKKLYDIAKDPHGLRDIARQKTEAIASNRQINRGIVRPDEMRDTYHKEIKDAGFHGIYNSSLDDTMSHAVGMFEPMKPIAEHKIHPNDFKETSAKDHHALDKEKQQAQTFAQETGHHNHEFLHNLANSFKE
jgi:hypothetical protein